MDSRQKAPKMPESFVGKSLGNGGGWTITDRREWTESEVRWIEDLRRQGFSTEKIAESVGRSRTSVSLKLKRMQKGNASYNRKHVAEKYAVNESYFEQIAPRTILDVYAGKQSFWERFNGVRVVSNDIKKEFDTTYHYDALKLMCLLYADGKKFDVVDLDPFGSAYDCFDLAIKMAGKGIVITFGELGHQRWKRLDFVSRYYGIDSLDDFTLNRLVEEVQAIGARNKKQLTVLESREWKNIGRVWFAIEPMKVLSK